MSALPIDGTYPTGTTKWEKRNLAQEIPVWEQDICIQCGKCAMVCPHGVIRIKIYDPAHLEDAPATFKSTDVQRSRMAGHEIHHSGGARGLHGLRHLRGHLPGQEQVRDAAEGHQYAAAAAAARAGTRELGVLLNMPDMDRRQIKVDYPPAAGAAAPVRVLRRLLGLRRDALSQAAEPVLRRPPGGGQRHGLLLDLRRQSAHHSLDQQRRGPRPGLVQLALRG